jgi:hypothetical protein
LVLLFILTGGAAEFGRPPAADRDLHDRIEFHRLLDAGQK